MPPGSRKGKEPGKKREEPKRPPMPSTGCSKCSYRWVEGKGWTPVWNTDCPVHPNPSDLL